MRFGISETSWILPKILRIRLDAVSRFSGAGAALVAMWSVCLAAAPSCPQVRGSGLLLSRPGRAGAEIRSAQTQKAADLQLGDRSFSVLETSADPCVEC